MSPVRADPQTLRLVLSSAALAVSAPAAVAFALLGLPQILVIGLSLLAALALINVAGIIAAGRQA